MSDLLTIEESAADTQKYCVESEEDVAFASSYEGSSVAVVYLDDEWDEQMRVDAEMGRLENLAAAARAEFISGGTSPFPPDDE